MCMECSESNDRDENHEQSSQLSSLRWFIQDLFDSANADKEPSIEERQEKAEDATTGADTFVLNVAQCTGSKPRAPRARPSPLQLAPIGKRDKMMLAHHQRIWDVRRKINVFVVGKF